MGDIQYKITGDRRKAFYRKQHRFKNIVIVYVSYTLEARLHYLLKGVGAL